MKARRHGLILSIIKEKSIETQEALGAALKAEGGRSDPGYPFAGHQRTWSDQSTDPQWELPLFVALGP